MPLLTELGRSFAGVSINIALRWDWLAKKLFDPDDQQKLFK